MKMLLSLGMLIFTVVAGPAAIAQSIDADMKNIAQQLERYSRQLGSIEKSLRAHAKTTAPKGLDSAQRSRFEAERRELVVTADSVRELIAQVDVRARKARQRILTRTDMERLQVDVSPVERLANRPAVEAPEQKSMDSSALNDAIRDVDTQRETARNKGRNAQTAFRNYDQKSNQIYRQLSSLMKTLNDMRIDTMSDLL